MTKVEMIEDVLRRSELNLSKKDAESLIDGFIRCITAEVKKGEIRVNDLGTFKLKKRKARTGRNPHTGESIKIAASKTVGFKPAKTLKDSL